MGLLQWAVISAAGYGVYKYMQRDMPHQGKVAFAT